MDRAKVQMSDGIPTQTAIYGQDGRWDPFLLQEDFRACQRRVCGLMEIPRMSCRYRSRRTGGTSVAVGSKRSPDSTSNPLFSSEHGVRPLEPPPRRATA